MCRKKLPDSSRCGVRHGPPIGRLCERKIEEFEKNNAEMGEAPKSVEGEGDAVKSLSHKEALSHKLYIRDGHKKNKKLSKHKPSGKPIAEGGRVSTPNTSLSQQRAGSQTSSHNLSGLELVPSCHSQGEDIYPGHQHTWSQSFLTQRWRGD